jgi:hypothetical protein
MILGVDHIALSCKNISQGAKLLAEEGFRVKFVQEDVPNHPSKRHLLTSHHPLHSVAYCQSQSGISIELTQHSSQLNDKGALYQVLLSKPPSNATPSTGTLLSTWESSWCAALECVSPERGLWHPFHAQFWYDAHEDEQLEGGTFIRALLVPITNLSASERFWVKGLGCRVVAQGIVENEYRWARVAFQTPVQTWSLDVVLVESDRRTVVPHLDDSGFPCLAVITNRITDDQETLLEMGGHDTSDTFTLEVDGKTLGVFILRGPGNELVELVEFQRK